MPDQQRRLRRGRMGGNRPPWWPADSPWPPPEPIWKEQRQRFLRVAIIASAAFVLLLCFGGFALFFAVGGSNRQESRPPFVGPLFLLAGLFGLGLLFRFGRRFRRLVLTVADLVGVTHQVAEGDLSARIITAKGDQAEELAQAFNSMVETLDRNDEQRRRLLADIAHEFRTPLSVVQGTVEAMIDGVYPPDEQHLQPLLAEMAVINRLLDDLQLLAMAESGGLMLHVESVDVATLISDAVSAFQAQASHKSLRIAANSERLPDVELDPIRIRQVLENLLSNAIRHTPECGAIEISAMVADNRVIIQVADSGIGLLQSQREQMFDRFVKSADSGGSGLGLAIARSLISAHGGTIAATENPGGGTIVTINLPVN